MDELKKRRFIWGVVLAWTPWVPTLVGIGYAFRGISEQRATGLGAVGAGLAVSFVLYGVGAILVGEVAAIVLLLRAFSPGHWARGLFSVVSVCLSGLMLFLVGIFLWFACFQFHHTF